MSARPWWFNSGDRGWIDCAGGHRAGHGWMFRGPRGRLYCRTCAVRLLAVKLPPSLDWLGWAPFTKSKALVHNCRHNRPVGVSR